MRAALLLLALTTSLYLGCEVQEPRTALQYSEHARRAYEEAMEEFRAHNWIESQALFQEIRRKYSYSRYARLAELRIADADFEQEKYPEAVRGYRQFIHDHRSDTSEVLYARAQIAEAQYRQISDSFILPTTEERDQVVVLEAYRELKSYLHDYPDATESKKIRSLLLDVVNRLIRHELYVARFYLEQDRLQAAVDRVRYAIDRFESEGEHGGADVEAYLLLGETYLKMHRWEEARSAFEKIRQAYPTHGLSIQAQNYLAKMQSDR